MTTTTNQTLPAHATERWGDFKTMGREELLLTKSDLERNLFKVNHQIQCATEAGEEVTYAMREKKRRLTAVYQRCNLFIGIEAASRRAEGTFLERFRMLAKDRLDPEVYQAIMQGARNPLHETV